MFRLENKKFNQSSEKYEKLRIEQELEPEIDPVWKPTTITVSILNEENMQTDPIVENYQLYKNVKGQIVGSYLAYHLRKKNIIAPQSTLCFFNFEKNIYVFGFTLGPKIIQETEENQKEKSQTPFILKNNQQKFIKPSNIKDNTLYIKIRNKKKSIVSSLLEEQKIDLSKIRKEKGEKQKEKKIREVLQRVTLWRKFFTGYHDQNDDYKEMELEDAAKMVAVSKKTLDDYLLQIRYGKKFGFDFHGNIEAKIGTLRRFIRDMKEEVGQNNRSV